MKISRFLRTLVLLLPCVSLAQGGPPPGEDHPHMHGGMMAHEMGKWWQDSDLSKKLQLSDAQTKQLDQIFFDHRMKLIDYGADMEKQDLKLQTLLDQDVPDSSAGGVAGGSGAGRPWKAGA